MYIMSIDYEKAFDRAPQDKLWNIIKNIGFPDHIVKTVQILYINTRMKTDKGASVGSKELQGVIQGCPVSPKLLNVSIDVTRQWQYVLTENFKTGNTILNTLKDLQMMRLFSVNQRITKEQSTDLKT